MSKRSKANSGRSGAVRQSALNWAQLAKQEDHGKREDESSQKRRVREAEPLVYGSLDVRDCRDAHASGVKMSGRKACLHALVQFPTQLIDPNDEAQQRRMLDHAVRFLNDFHGGDAVFAARLDRDEKGQHSVDAFLLPRYDFHYADGRTAKKASLSKFSKQHARERFGQFDKTGKPRLDKNGQQLRADDPRSQGRALQAAWFEYMRDEMGLDVLPPQRKKSTAKDRVEPEEYALAQERAKQRDQKFSQDKMFLDQHRAIKAQKQALKDDRAALEADRAKLDKERAAAEVLSKDAQMALAVARKATEGLGKPEAAQALGERQTALRRRREPEIGD